MIDYKMELDEILKEYKNYLEEKNHRKEYIQDHLNFLRFFGINYLGNYMGLSILNLDSIAVEGFLGDWCIRKVYDFKRGDIIPNLRIFKKFNSFLFHTGKISKETYHEIKDICNSPRKIVEKFEGYTDLDPDAEDWNKIYERWLFGYNAKTQENLKEDIKSILDFDKTLIENLPEGNKDRFSIIKDFKTFINYISKFKKGVKLTSNTFCLKRKDIRELNSMMTNSEALDKYVIQTDTILIHFFFLGSKKLGLTQYTKKMNLKTTSLYEFYLRLSEKQQFWILYRGLWDKINWYRLNEYSSNGRPKWCFAGRYNYLNFFSKLEVDKWFSYRDLINLYNQLINQPTNFNLIGNTNLTLFVIGVFPNKVLPLLSYFRFFELTSKMRGDLENYEDFRLKITPLGNYIFSNLKEIERS